MKELIGLAKLFINESWGISQFLYNKNHNQKAFFKQLGLMVVLLVALFPSYLMYISFMGAFYAGLSYVGQTSAFLVFGFVMTTMLIIIFGIMQVLSEFYFSKNIEELIPLPLSPEKLILGKFTAILASEYIFTLIAYLPVLVIYGIAQGMGLLYALLCLPVIIALPIMPLALLTALFMLIMKGSSIKGRQDVIQMLFSIFFVAAILGLQFYFSSQLSTSSDGDIQEILNTMLANSQMLLNQIAYLVPASFLVAWGLNAITPMSVVWIVLLLLLAGVSLFILVQVGKRFYLSSLVSGTITQKSKVLSEEQRQKKIHKNRSKALAIFFMDMQNMLRTPIFLFNNVSVVVIVPICLLLGLTFSGLNQSDLAELQNFYNEMPFIATYILIGIFIFFGATSATTATSFSREGRASWTTRVIPVSAREQIIGRTLSALLIQGLGMVFTVAVVCYILPLKVETIILALLLGLVGSVPILFLGLFIDVSRPLIDWDNPQKAVKNNMNVLITLFVGMLYMAIVIGLSLLAGSLTNSWLGYLLYFILNSAISVLMYLLLNRQLERKLIQFDN
ncbi:hypothetical protein Q5O24_12815 [Eubacteriaceae bacterium ES3]|nr:hypothetical protein Q5O24_12815 [Eubacteriaceae bacterium ES3]